MSKLYLVGAGPGDPELITLKAINVLKKADVILYDALANEELLTYCNDTCDKIYVGKKPGIHQYQQIFINDLIVDCSRVHKNIVRLKGGDPFVFGRGYEELDHARKHGIEVEIIPGISSALAVPAINEIPLTCRGINESFWVVTGTTLDQEISKDVYLAAQSSASVIILMGMKRLGLIVDKFKTYRGGDEPIGIIQNGTKENQKEVFGSLDDIEKKVEESDMSAPAIIIIGDVVKLNKCKELVMANQNQLPHIQRVTSSQ
ncbi:MAG: uroporphyrinogen-III C-methyltransferase [Bacteroidota bacterium]